MLNHILDIARQAGDEILTWYDGPIHVETKEDNTPLTKADVASHQLILRALQELTPEIPVLSEEGGIAGWDERKTWERFWLVDPIDGTKEFIKKSGEFTVNIALIQQNEPILGVVHLPAMGATYSGERGKGAFLYDKEGESRKIYSREPDTSRPVTILASRSHRADRMEAELAEMGITIGETIPAGSSLKFCYLAEGKADLYPRFGPTMEWDTGAGDAVFRYSGRNGERSSPLTYNKKDLRNEGFVLGLG